MRCEQARQLFDAYLDGELSPSLATELGAHRLQCPACRQAIALLEVSGHIMRTDADSVRPDAGFTDRLLACMKPRQTRWRVRLRRTLYAGGLAAAAVVVLALFGAFDGRTTKVAGHKSVLIDRGELQRLSTESPSQKNPEAAGPVDANERRLEQLLQQAKQNLNRKRESGESLQRALDETISHWADMLNNARETLPTDSPDRAAPPESPPADPDDTAAPQEPSNDG